MGTSKDLAAIRAVLSGDPEAFEGIVHGYQNLVASVAYRLGVPRNDIEDIVSEVFVKVYRHLDGYRPEFSLSTWIYKIASNHVLDWLRRNRHARAAVPLTVSLEDPAPPISERLAERERAERIREALADVPEKYRLPIVLMHVEGRSVEEIARILSLPANTVKTRLARGRTRFAEVLKRRCPDLMEAAS